MPKELDMSAMENCVCFNLRRVTRKVTQFFDAEMRRHGIRPTQGSILEALQAKDSWTMAELSDWLGMDRTTLVRNLRPLQRDGLVKVGGGGRGRLVGWLRRGVRPPICRARPFAGPSGAPIRPASTTRRGATRGIPR